MAGVAVSGRALLRMTVEAAVHEYWDCRHGQRRGVFTHVAVTLNAFDVSQSHVSAVREIHVPRNLVDTPPGNLLALRRVLPDLLFFWIVRDRSLVAHHAGFGCRHPSERGFFDCLVAGITRQTLLDMGLVTKLNGLDDRRRVATRRQRQSSH
jgi:hypothetical protein